MLIYLADLVHSYYPGLNTVPLNIAYLAAYAKKCFGDDIDIRLFKYCDDLLDAIRDKQPSLVGLSNYTWNESLNGFVGRYIKQHYSQMPIIMGGPNIRYDREGIESFLRSNDFIDVYITFEGEIPFVSLLKKILSEYSSGIFTGEEIRNIDVDSCFSLKSGILKGQHAIEERKVLDYIPSPYKTGLLDDFLASEEYIPLFESNRGCPYSCSYCTWGINARKYVKQFSLERIHSDMEYVAKQGKIFPNWTFADANFGILSRDVEIARDIRAIHDKYRPFHTLTLWSDKNAKDRVVEIAKILKGLSTPYVAFQTFDPYVEKMIKRNNISVNRLLKISQSMPSSSERFHTDILLGLPGETRDSHLRSLSKAYELGFNSIGGGEIRLLKGSDLETDESRKNFNIMTKYRLVQEGFGVYKGHFVAEFEESVRSTKWITEEEMFKLRVLRAIFFGAVTIGELGPMAAYLKMLGINIIDLIQKIIEMRESDALVAESINWLSRQAQNEWFTTKEEAMVFFSSAKNRAQLLENPTIKLNYDFLSYLILSPDKYNAFHEFVSKILNQHFPSVNSTIVNELSLFCRARNYIAQCMRGSADTRTLITLSDETIEQLIATNYICIPEKRKPGNVLLLTIDGSIAKSIYNSVQIAKPKVQTISLLCQRFPIYSKPAKSPPHLS
ncbi:B12-binding domain-containing radical SAM protein [Candidatus Margulisiibacteriota bacterium]